MAPYRCLEYMRFCLLKLTMNSQLIILRFLWLFYKIVLLVESVSASGGYHFSSSISEQYDSSQLCNFTGMSLFCQDSKSEMDVNICYFCADGNAMCSTVYNYAMICRFGRVYIRDCYCLTYDYNKTVMSIGSCLYNCEKEENKGIKNGYNVLPNNISEVNSSMCGKWHRDRALCGQCEDGYFPMAYSYNMSCIKCPHSHFNWLKLALFVLIPLTGFCFVVMLFNISITSSYLHGFVLFSQALSIPAMSRVIFISYKEKDTFFFFIKLLGCYYSIWNLDILRSFSPRLCLHIKSLDTLTLDIAIGVYPLILIVITHWTIAVYDRKNKVLRILWKPFSKLLGSFHRQWEFKTTLIDSFVTFVILSNVKLMSACFDLLAPMTVRDITSSGISRHRSVLFYDGSTSVHSNSTRTVLACCVLLVFAIFPIVLLFLYPFKLFQKILNRIPVRWHVLHTIVDAFQGCYKNGINCDTRDFRWFSSLFLLSRLLVFIIYAGTLSSVFFCYAPMLTVLLTLLIVNFEPFAKEIDNKLNCFFLLLLSIWLVGAAGVNLSLFVDSRMIWFFYLLCAVVAVFPLAFPVLILLRWHKKQKVLFATCLAT